MASNGQQNDAPSNNQKRNNRRRPKPKNTDEQGVAPLSQFYQAPKGQEAAGQARPNSRNRRRKKTNSDPAELNTDPNSQRESAEKKRIRMAATEPQVQQHSSVGQSEVEGNHPKKSRNNRRKKGNKPAQDVDANQMEIEQPPQAQAAAEPASSKLVHMTDARFDALAISANTKRAISEVLGYPTMTLVQKETLPSILSGVDVLAKAKTGTGKTLAFLIPCIENLVRSGTPASKTSISVLILSPTRELAAQISTECESLLKFHQYKHLCMFGGTPIGKDHRRLSGGVDILVATPGRLVDHFDNTKGFASKFDSLGFLIFDEADQMLDMGFKPAIDKITSFLPPAAHRQTLLFSATVPSSLKSVITRVLRPNFVSIDTVGDEVDQTHEHVEQLLFECDIQSQPEVLARVLEEKAQNPFHKIIVFFTTARVTGFMAELFNAAGQQVFEIHSRKSQSQREKASKLFASCKSGIMFTSDVSARGMDYPDVTFVLQVGVTTREQYIHRLGRTARAGKSGQGGLLLADFEEDHMLHELSDMPLIRSEPQLSCNSLAARVNAAIRSIHDNPGNPLRTSGSQSYQAWLGFYNSHLRKLRWSKSMLVEQAAAFAKSVGFDEAPSLEAKTVGKMGLKGTPGLNVRNGHGGRGGGGGGGRGGGRGGGGRGRGGGRR